MRKLTSLEKALEYLDFLNQEGNFIEDYDKDHKFSNGTFFEHYFARRKNFLKSLVSQEEYQNKYRLAKRKIDESVCPDELLKQDISDIIQKILTEGYSPKVLDKVSCFADGTKINNFCVLHGDDILRFLQTKEEYQDNKYKKVIDVLKDFCVFLSEQKKQMSFNDKMQVFIENLNNLNCCPFADKHMIFADYTLMVDFWQQHRERIARELHENHKYSDYEVAKERCKSILPSTLFYEQKLDEYIRYYLNRGYTPVGFEERYSFSSRERLKDFWSHRQEIENALFKKNGLYSDVIYNHAREVLHCLKERQIKEFINLLNSGYVPCSFEKSICFYNHELIGDFWLFYRKSIYDVFFSSPKYLSGYEIAGNLLSSYMTFDEKKKYFSLQKELYHEPYKVKRVLTR